MVDNLQTLHFCLYFLLNSATVGLSNSTYGINHSPGSRTLDDEMSMNSIHRTSDLGL